MMHRNLMNTPDGLETDHVNGDKLDNRRSNLRICTRGENAHNCKKPNRGKNRLKGVSFGANGWEAYINWKDRKQHLGFFKNELDAATVYNVAAQLFFGEFARLNIIPNS